MAFDRTFWERLRRKCAVHFWYKRHALGFIRIILIHSLFLYSSFDDYNWDWSLQHVSTVCFASKVKVMAFAMPRVIHLGKW